MLLVEVNLDFTFAELIQNKLELDSDLGFFTNTHHHFNIFFTISYTKSIDEPLIEEIEVYRYRENVLITVLVNVGLLIFQSISYHLIDYNLFMKM